MLHLGESLNKNRFGEAAGRFQQQIIEKELRLGEGDDAYQGRILYNLACSQALDGKPAAAIENLRKSLRLNPELVAWSKEDSDLDALRALPEFQALYQ